MCIWSRIYPNKKYLPNKKNNYNPPTPKDTRVLAVPTKCGECIECVKAKKHEWAVRLKEEIRERRNGKYVTLTFSNEEIAKLYTEKSLKHLRGYKLDNAVAALAKDRFKERWRKKYKEYPRYWLVTELGHRNTEHLHFHGIIWTDNPIEETWKYGGVYIGRYREANYWGRQYVNERTVNYITKYILKKDPKHLTYKSVIFCNDGMGSGYMKRQDWKTNRYIPNGKTNESYRDTKGIKSALPIYLRNKIYSEEEKEQLWLEKLDKKERWVLGQKIDVSQNDKQLFEALQAAQRLNKKRGFGNGIKNWTLAEYENQLRLTKQNERITAAKKNGLKDIELIKPNTDFESPLTAEELREREYHRKMRKELAEWEEVFNESE